MGVVLQNALAGDIQLGCKIQARKQEEAPTGTMLHVCN